MRKSLVMIVALALGLVACSDGRVEDVASTDLVTGPWELLEDVSTVSFVSIKKNTIAESHHFTSLTGHVDSEGKTVVTIILDSVETNIDIRNARMREHLFETGHNPYASIQTDIDLSALTALEVGQRQQLDVSLSIDLHGISNVQEADLMVTNIGAGRVLVETRLPILVSAQDYGLLDGITKLQTLAKLPAITPTIPVSFSLVFAQE